MSEPMRVRVPQKTLRHLEWSRVLERLAEHCRGPVAQERALELAPLRDERALRGLLQLVDEARALLDQGHSPPLGQPSDITPAVARATRGGVLEVEELRDVGASLDAAFRSRRFFKPFERSHPALADLAVGLADLQDIAREISASVTPQGELSDHASGDLGHLRAKVSQLSDQLKERVSGLVSDEAYAGMLQDEFFTLREDRYVLPIKSGHKRHVEGIVHGWSASGATVYIEPQVVVEANNKLVMAQAEVKREVHRVLTRLTQRVAQRAREILESHEALVDLDLVFAKATLSKELSATSPLLTHEPSLCLRGARHPLLQLAGVRVVPNDIFLGAQEESASAPSVLVVTGPNAGGKTVVMKTAGLLALMGLSGLHVPAEPGATLPLVPCIFSDMGDEQDLSEGQSTFSGHMANLSGVLRLHERNSLVLLDELAIGTDPAQGAALAQAVLEHFADLGSLVFVTTHYEALKLLPREDARFRNGAVEYDEQAHAPTYHLRYDTPGGSSALQIARRCGLPEGLLERAQALSGEQRQRLEQVIAELAAEASAARLAKEEARAEAARLRDLSHNVAMKERKLTERLEKAIDAERHKAITEARKARDAARALRERLREQSAAASAEALAAQEREMDSLADGLAADDARDKLARYPQDLDLAALKVGQRVWVISLSNHAEVTRLPNSKGRCVVSAGRLSVDVDAAELRQPRARSAKERERDRELEQQRKREREEDARPRAPQASSWETASPQSPDLTCDVRGQRVEDAFVIIERHLDGLVGRGASAAYIIHGHGTGALKKAVRDWLRRHAQVQDQRPGQPHEGGDGVTAALLTTRRA